MNLARQVSKTRGQQRAQSKAAMANTADLLWSRRANLSGSTAGWSQTQCCHLSSRHYIPNRPLELRDSMQSRAYIGQYSHEGNLYVGEALPAQLLKLYVIRSQRIKARKVQIWHNLQCNLMKEVLPAAGSDVNGWRIYQNLACVTEGFACRRFPSRQESAHL